MKLILNFCGMIAAVGSGIFGGLGNSVFRGKSEARAKDGAENSSPSDYASGRKADNGNAELGRLVESDIYGRLGESEESEEQSCPNDLQAVVDAAVRSVADDVAEVTDTDVRGFRRGGRSVYQIGFTLRGKGYLVAVDGESAQPLARRALESEDYDVERRLSELFKAHGLRLSDIREHTLDSFIEDEAGSEGEETAPVVEPLSRDRLLLCALNGLRIEEREVDRAEVILSVSGTDPVGLISLVTDCGDEYKVITEACTGAVVSVELNGVTVESAF